MKLILAFISLVLSLGIYAQETNDPPINAEDVFNFAKVDRVPVFDGCDDDGANDEIFACLNSSLVQFISQNFKYPKKARKKKIEGKVYINFIVEKDGRVTNVSIARGAHELLDKEALRVIKSLPQFKPALVEGKPVRMQYTVPINCALK